MGKVLNCLGVCLMLTGIAGCGSNTDVFEIKSPDYNFKMVLKNDVPTEIIENGQTYSKEDIEISKNLIEYDGKDSFFEGMFTSVLMNTQASVELNGKDYKTERKKIFKNELSKSSCRLDGDDVTNIIRINASDGIVKSSQIIFEYAGNFNELKENEVYIENLKSDIINSLKSNMNLYSVSDDDMKIEVLEDKLICTLEVESEDLNNFSSDQITLIKNLAKNNYICE